MGKISSTSQKISFCKQELPPPIFKSFKKALNKKKNTLSVSASRNEEFVKKTFPLDGKTVFAGRNICQMEKAVARKTFPTRSKEFFKKIVLHVSIMASTSKKL